MIIKNIDENDCYDFHIFILIDLEMAFCSFFPVFISIIIIIRFSPVFFLGTITRVIYGKLPGGVEVTIKVTQVDVYF